MRGLDGGDVKGVDVEGNAEAFLLDSLTVCDSNYFGSGYLIASQITKPTNTFTFMNYQLPLTASSHNPCLYQYLHPDRQTNESNNLNLISPFPTSVMIPSHALSPLNIFPSSPNPPFSSILPLIFQPHARN